MSESLACRARSLKSRASLDAREWAEMRDHATHTRAILGRIGAFSDMADIAAAHHERLDGGGYPLALPGAAISRLHADHHDLRLL